jgi:hypothetical protein
LDTFHVGAGTGAIATEAFELDHAVGVASFFDGHTTTSGSEHRFHVNESRFDQRFWVHKKMERR